MPSNSNSVAISLLAFATQSNREVTDHLANIFVELASRVEILCAQLESDQTSSGNAARQAAAFLQSNEISALLNLNIYDMQIHDITSQRLEHVARLLEGGHIQGDELVKTLGNLLTERGEQQFAELILNQVPTEHAIDFARSETPGGSIELF